MKDQRYGSRGGLATESAKSRILLFNMLAEWNYDIETSAKSGTPLKLDWINNMDRTRVSGIEPSSVICSKHSIVEGYQLFYTQKWGQYTLLTGSIYIWRGHCMYYWQRP